MTTKRECEIKYPFREDEQKEIEKRIAHINFRYIGEQNEIDFVPDVKEFLCRKNNVLLRFREIRKENTTDVLITLKQKGNAKEFQEYFEIEFTLSQFDELAFKKINNILFTAAGKKLPENIKNCKTFKKVKEFVQNEGFTETRILLEKKRKIFKGKKGKITIDVFPEGMGSYIEVETDTPEKLNALVEDLNLDKAQLIKEDYGDILKEYKKDLPEAERRVALF